MYHATTFETVLKWKAAAAKMEENWEERGGE
jgi:hypothetical protein